MIQEQNEIPWEMPAPINCSNKLKFKEAKQKNMQFLV